MKYNPELHHRKSVRLQGYDYAAEGRYFITLCLYKHTCLFGDIVDNKMVLNDAGIVANQCWTDIPKHFPHAILHKHIIIPNHVHGIIEIMYNETFDNGDANVGANDGNFRVGTQDIDHAQVGAENFLPLQRDFSPSSQWTKHPSFHSKNHQKNEFQKMIPRSICAIVKGYKIGVTNWFHNNTEEGTIWQRNYHEHIIRNDKEYRVIAQYIIHNPANWKEDKFYKA